MAPARCAQYPCQCYILTVIRPCGISANASTGQQRGREMPGHTSYLLAVQAPTRTGFLVHQSLCLSQKVQALQSPIFSGMVVVFTSCCSAPKPLLYVLLCDAGSGSANSASEKLLPGGFLLADGLSVGRTGGRLEDGRK